MAGARSSATILFTELPVYPSEGWVPPKVKAPSSPWPCDSWGGRPVGCRMLIVRLSRDLRCLGQCRSRWFWACPVPPTIASVPRARVEI